MESEKRLKSLEVLKLLNIFLIPHQSVLVEIRDEKTIREKREKGKT